MHVEHTLTHIHTLSSCIENTHTYNMNSKIFRVWSVKWDFGLLETEVTAGASFDAKDSRGAQIICEIHIDSPCPGAATRSS